MNKNIRKIFKSALVYLKKMSLHSLFFIKIVTPPQLFSCKICEIFKNTYFVEDLLTAASD